MKRKRGTFFSPTLGVTIGGMLLANLGIDGDLSWAQSVRRGNRLPPPPSVRQPNKKYDGGGRSICSSCRLPVSSSPPVPSRVPAVSPREYVFQAPPSVRPASVTTVSGDQKPRSAVQPPTQRSRQTPNPSRSQPAIAKPPESRRVISSNQLFRVQVTGASESALTKIKAIEPLAFIRPGESVIQAGLFQQHQEAKARVQALSSLGFTAQIVSLTP
jgi:hypothetical protein